MRFVCALAVGLFSLSGCSTVFDGDSYSNGGKAAAGGNAGQSSGGQSTGGSAGQSSGGVGGASGGSAGAGGTAGEASGGGAGVSGGTGGVPTVARCGVPADNFDDASLDPQRWGAWHKTIVFLEGGELRMTPGTFLVTGVTSAISSDLSQCSTTVELAKLPTVPKASIGLRYFDATNKSDVLEFGWADGALVARAAGTEKANPFVPGTKWLRVTSFEGTSYFQYSSDGSTWSDHSNLPTPTGAQDASVSLVVGTYQTVTDPILGAFDNFNMP